MDFPDGILITPAHSLCFKYDMKSWNCRIESLAHKEYEAVDPNHAHHK